jgi:hypothetical protein
MGIPIGSLTDIASRVAAGTLSAAQAAPSISMQGNFNITLYGTFAATIAPERSFDGGTTWLQLSFSDGTPVQISAPASTSWSESEAGVLYRLRCSSYTSGTITWRISQ